MHITPQGSIHETPGRTQRWRPSSPQLDAEDLGWVSLGQGTKIGVHRSGYVAFNPGATGALVWTCPTRWYAISGGFDTLAAKGFRLVESYPQRVGPDVGFRQWKLRLKNLDNAGKQYARIWVVYGN